MKQKSLNDWQPDQSVAGAWQPGPDFTGSAPAMPAVADTMELPILNPSQGSTGQTTHEGPMA